MEDKEKLLKESAQIFENIGWTPATAKILALFYVSNQKYFTFEELLDRLKLSKSTASRALNLLLDTEKVKYIIKDNNKRKRHFYISIDGSLSFIHKYQNILEAQQKLLEKLLSVRDESNPKFNQFIQHEIAYLEKIIPILEKQKKYFKQ